MVSDSRNLGGIPPESVIFGCSEPMQVLRRKVDKLAAATVPVLIEGESGTGKDIVAQLIHLKSLWASGPFFKLNCPGIPDGARVGGTPGFEELLEAGACSRAPGQLGTLFLDEVSELDRHLQSKLLQLLQDGPLCRIGTQDNSPRVRVICGTSWRLEDAVATGRFRRDLFYRLNVANVRIPPLRQRAADIPMLVEYFLQMFHHAADGDVSSLSSPVMRSLVAYTWPGNVRELKNLIERYVLFGSEDAICAELQGSEVSQSRAEAPVTGQISLKKLTKNAVREFERQVIFQVLKANDWNRKRAARALSISYRALLYKLKEAGLPPTSSGQWQRQATSPGEQTGARVSSHELRTAD